MVKHLLLLLATLALSTILLAADKGPSASAAWKSFFSRKTYSASIRDTVHITSSTLASGPVGAVSVVLSDPACVLQNRGDDYVFYSAKTGVFKAFFSSRTSGSLLLDTITITITDQPPVLEIGSREVIADINKLFSFDLKVTDDGNAIRVLLDLDGDGRIDTSCCGVANPGFRFTRPTRTGEKEKQFPCRITVIDNDSHAVSDTALLTVLYKPPRARAGSNVIACADEPVVFSARTSRDENGSISRYIWDFDADGKSDSVLYVPEVERVFSSIGDFSVILRVMDNDNNISRPDTITMSVYKDKPTVSIKAPHETKAGEAFAFIGIGKVNCAEIDKYLWDFEGSGSWDFTSRSHGRTAHTYKTAGQYQAKFMVLDSKGDSAYLIWPVKVNP